MFAKRAITLESKNYLPLCTCSNHSASILCMSTSDLLSITVRNSSTQKCRHPQTLARVHHDKACR